MSWFSNFFDSAGWKDLPFLNGLLSIIRQYLVYTASAVFFLLLIYVIHGVYKAKRVYGSKAGNAELCFVSFMEGIAWIIRNIPYIAGCILVISMLHATAVIAGGVNEFIRNEKRIKELSAVVKNLQRKDLVAKVSLYKTEGDKKTYLLELFSGDADKSSVQMVEMRGNEFWMDCIVVNFDYSEVSSGKQVNVSYPYRIWSEKISPENAYVLNSVPYMFDYGEDVYCIDGDSYKKRLAELFSIIQDEKNSRMMGIRSFNGNAVHFEVNGGEKYLIKTLGTGGITVSREENWD